MTSAYTALPGAAYSLVMTMATSSLAGDALPVIGSFRLDGTRRTIEPPDPTVTWTAAVDGSPVDLRIAGVGSFESSITSEAADSGIYWQSSTSLEFEDIGSAVDQILTVTGSATMIETAVSDSKAAAVPDYSLVATGPTAISFDTAAATTASFRADSIDKTVEPSNKAITWTATVDGSPVDLRIDGGFAASQEDTVVDSGDFWEVTSSLKFDLSEAYEERAMVVTGAGVIDGLAVNDTAAFTVSGWSDIRYSFLTEFTRLYDYEPYIWKIIVGITVYTLPTTEDWHKRIRYEVDGDQVYSEVVEEETGTDPGGITITTVHDGDYSGDTPWDATHLLNITVNRQQTNKKYRILTYVLVRQTPERWVGTYTQEVFRTPGDLISSVTDTSIISFAPGYVDIETTDTTIAVSTFGAMW